LWRPGDDSVGLVSSFEYTVNAVAFSPDGRYIASGSDQSPTDGRLLSTLRLFDMKDGFESPLQPPDGRGLGVWSLAFHPNGDALAVGWNNGTVDLLDIPSGDRITELPRGAAVNAIAFSPDGSLLATLPGRGVRIWDVRPGGFFPRLLLGEHAERAWTLAFTPSGDYLATGGWDSTVRLWDPQTGAERARYDWQLGRILAVAFAPDGLTAAAAGNANDIIIWDVD
jgi:WD40 repeat protein